MGILESQSNGSLYSNTVIVTLAVDGRVVLWYSKEGPGRPQRAPSSLYQM